MWIKQMILRFWIKLRLDTKIKINAFFCGFTLLGKQNA